MNMKKIINISIVCIFGFIEANTQTYQYVPFPTGNTVWSEKSCICDGFCNVYDKYIITGEDTIINNNNYKKLYLFFDSVFNSNNAFCLGGIREENKKIYYCGEQSFYNNSINYYKPYFIDGCQNNEILLYDFSLNIGDTLTNINYCFNTIDPNISGEMKIVVSDIDTLFFNNSCRKVFYFYETSGYTFYTYWIEGIGSNRGLLFF